MVAVGCAVGQVGRAAAERAHVLAEIAVPAVGDVADRATNVDANVRLALLDRRIAAVADELAGSRGRRGQRRRRSGAGGGRSLAIGDLLTVDFGDGPEVFVFAPVEVAEAGYDVITPHSPLGRALHGAPAGSTVTVATGRGNRQAALVAVGGPSAGPQSGPSGPAGSGTAEQ